MSTTRLDLEGSLVACLMPCLVLLAGGASEGSCGSEQQRQGEVDDPTLDSGPAREDLGGPADAAGSTDGGPAQVDLGEPVDQGPFLNDSGQLRTDGPAWPPADLGPGRVRA
ncbi:MAG: hypothetical protein FJ125_11710, partial [Deltaproteobacteria bacterium]|nr:hypothetical protein [Deltaproteobacteria bacterium]